MKVIYVILVMLMLSGCVSHKLEEQIQEMGMQLSLEHIFISRQSARIEKLEARISLLEDSFSKIPKWK